MLSRRWTSSTVLLVPGLMLAFAGAGTANTASAGERLEVRLLERPAARAFSGTARFSWRANRRVSNALCTLDRRPPRPCGRRPRYRGLRPGGHRLRITVFRGRRSAHVSYAWRVQRRRSDRRGIRSGVVPVDAPVLWKADMEEGSLADWVKPERRSAGGGEYNSGGGDSWASRDRASSGSWSAKSVLTGGRGGTRLFRWDEPRANRDLRYQARFLFPRSYRLTADPCCGAYWNILQFKSRSRSGAIDPIWFVDLQNGPDGSLRPTLVWWHRTLEGPHRRQSGFRRYQPLRTMTVPSGRWVTITARLRQSHGFDGALQVWIDGRLAFSQNGVRTSFENCRYNAWCAANEWSVNNYSDGLSAGAATVYIDDAQISR